MKDILKIRKETYELVAGDTMMNNGSCVQFITRKVLSNKGIFLVPTMVTKKAFEEFKALDRVRLSKKGTLDYWVYK